MYCVGVKQLLRGNGGQALHFLGGSEAELAASMDIEFKLPSGAHTNFAIFLSRGIPRHLFVSWNTYSFCRFFVIYCRPMG